MNEVEAQIPAAATQSPLGPPLGVKLAYSLGQAAQNGGFDAAVGFVFFYYSAVLGLSGSLVGAALAVSLAFDAVVDPVVGSWSDNLKSRMGRRLPLMFAAIPFVTAAMGLLFSPPSGLGQFGLFAWLAALSVAVRSSISLFNVPYIALGAEMASGYAERTSVVVYRAFAGIWAGVAVTVIGYQGFFADGGLQRPSGYPGFGWSVAGLLFICMSLCCLGIRRYAASLPQPERHDGSMLRRLPGELAEIFRNRSFRLLFVSAVVLFVAIGVNMSLNNHAFVFVWQIKSELIQYIGFGYLIGILLGILAAPLMQRAMEKKNVVITGFLLLIGNWLVVQCAMLAGVWHPLGGAALGPMVFNSSVAGIGTGFVSVAYPSMMADAADEHEYLYGTRREGLYFAGLGFANKAATGLGVMVAGVALDLIRFPQVGGPAAVRELPADMQFRLVSIWGPVPAVIALAALAVLAAYGITRARHDKIAAELQRRKG